MFNSAGFNMISQNLVFFLAPRQVSKHDTSPKQNFARYHACYISLFLKLKGLHCRGILHSHIPKVPDTKGHTFRIH